MSDWASVSRTSLVYAFAAILLVAVSSAFAVFGGSPGSLPSNAGQAGLVAVYAGAAGVTAWAASRHRVRSRRRAWLLVAAGLVVSMGSYGLNLDPSPTVGPLAMPQLWVMALLLGSFALFGSGFIVLALGLRHAPGSGKLLIASVALSLVMALLVAAVSLAPIGAGDSGLHEVDWGVMLLVCLDALLLLAPALFSAFAAARTADADPRVWLCLVAGALIMILGDALYPLIDSSGASILASVPWGMAVGLFGLGALMSADAAEAAESRIDSD
jgi:hypothetical protein